MKEYHRHADGQVVPGEAARCIDPNAGAEDVVVLTRDEYDDLVQEGAMR